MSPSSSQFRPLQSLRLCHCVAIIGIFLVATLGHSNSTAVSDHTVSLIIVGVNNDLERQVKAYITKPDSQDLPRLSDQIDQMVDDTKKSLRALGYYDASATVKHSSYKSSTIIEMKINKGEPTVISNVSLDVTGAATSNTEFQTLLQSLPIRERQIFNHGNYERTKDLLHSTARNLGFFNAKFTRSQVLVSRKESSAKIFIEFDSGPRFNISKVNYITDLFSDDFLERWQPFEKGIPFQASHALKLTQNLQNSGYFSFVRVKPETDLIEGSSIPLHVELEPASENVISLGVGFATDTGLRVKGNWLRPHHNDKGHILKGDASISKLRQEVSASYQIPHRRSPSTGEYSINIGILNHRTDDTFSQLRTMNVSDHRLTKHNWYRDIFLRWQNENTDDRDDRINLLLPGIGFSRTVSSGGLKPHIGSFQSVKLLGGSRKFLSDINMFQATASAKKLKSWNRKHYLITRLDLGFLKSDSFARVPISHRFFAGGDNSVRGFDYQSISPRNSDGEATGGKFLTTLSAEYNFYIRDRWALAGFIDTGRAFNDGSAPYKVGVGAGLRWLSPVGPLRVDVGIGVSEESNPVRLHLAIGPQL